MTRRLLSMMAVMATLASVLLQTSVAADLKLRVIHNFRATTQDGSLPYWIGYGPGGDIYGATTRGGTGQLGGSVFKLHRTGSVWYETILWESTAVLGPNSLESNLVFDAAGNIYGTSVFGGAYGYGTFFEISLQADGSWKAHVLHSFNSDGKDAFHPCGSLAMDGNGNIFGTAPDGGQYGDGAAFEFSPQGNGAFAEKLIHEWNEEVDGTEPSGLVMDAAGNLYGGAADNLWRLSPLGDGSYAVTILHALTSTEGFTPAHLSLGPDGALYGTLYNGGPGASGSAFKLVPDAGDNWTYTELGEFHRNHHDGIHPNSPLTTDSSGNLYGTNSDGGAKGAGTLFKLSLNADGSYSKTVLYTFGPKNSTALAYPIFGLLFDNHGSAYGLTSAGGEHQEGTVYQIRIGTNK